MLTHAIAELTRTAEIAENNGPIHDREGDPAQAALCRATATECRTVAALCWVLARELRQLTSESRIPSGPSS